MCPTLQGDALTALKNQLTDPTSVMQSWDATLPNPCTWFHVTCNSEDSVTRVELYSNNITGNIPTELGKLKSLMSLDLYLNRLGGNIPDTLGNLKKLRFLFNNNTNLTFPPVTPQAPAPSNLPPPPAEEDPMVHLGQLKRLREDRTQGGELQFQTEVEMISMAMHRNLLRLKGFCMTPTERLLVYPYMVNGSVASCMQDFGLAKLMSYKDTHVTTAVRGTIGHIAPEYLSTGRSSEKTDVFGYGVMLLELVTGQRAYDLARLEKDNEVMLLDWVKGLLDEKKLETLVDADLEGNYVNDGVEKLIQIALLCTQATPLDRPKMSEVVRMLEGDCLTNRWEEWQERRISHQEFSHTHIPYPFTINSDSYNPSNDHFILFSRFCLVELLDCGNGTESPHDLPLFQTEVEIIRMAVHRNLLRLLGFCMTPTERLLVYPYMVNGSVASCLRAANIFLDDEFEAVVGDWVLAKHMGYEDTQVTTAILGTIGHMAPEYLSTGRYSEKTDVFGFGVMLLELVTGQQAYDLARLEKDNEVMLLEWVKGLLDDMKLETIVDTDLEGNYVNGAVEKLIQIALLCTQVTPLDRPKMSEVVGMLEGDGLTSQWEEWQERRISHQEFSHTHIQYPCYINSNSYNPTNDHLSGPR
ncbi:hypothetical protein L1987_27158 [Smallanthus sonchifolius]|uniref:Uncharacterized protein n=1 Tax=Smallanthus sonchifolius TaxID=185202 RepID=A0ACB9IA37_9ASTR|nr:hypothetical protein L1987_27158 [Smallanthus sonchifolius]